MSYLKIIPEGKKTKKTISFRLTEFSVDNLRFLVRNTGISQSQIIGILIDRAADDVRLSVEEKAEKDVSGESKKSKTIKNKNKK